MTNYGFTGAHRVFVAQNSPTLPEWRPRGLASRWVLAVFVFLCAGLGLFLLPAEAYDSTLFGEPILKIIYSAESRGEVHPCFY